MYLKEYMQRANILFQGTKRIQWNSVLPGKKSVLYVYGVQFTEDGASYEATTAVAWDVIEPEYAPLQDVSFALDVEVDGAEIELSIAPENWDGYYVVKIVDANDDLYTLPQYTPAQTGVRDIWLSYGSANTKNKPVRITAVDFAIPSRAIDTDPENTSFEPRVLVNQFRVFTKFIYGIIN